MQKISSRECPGELYGEWVGDTAEIVSGWNSGTELEDFYLRKF